MVVRVRLLSGARRGNTYGIFFISPPPMSIVIIITIIAYEQNTTVGKIIMKIDVRSKTIIYARFLSISLTYAIVICRDLRQSFPKRDARRRRRRRTSVYYYNHFDLIGWPIDE